MVLIKKRKQVVRSLIAVAAMSKTLCIVTMLETKKIYIYIYIYIYICDKHLERRSKASAAALNPAQYRGMIALCAAKKMHSVMYFFSKYGQL